MGGQCPRAARWVMRRVSVRSAFVRTALVRSNFARTAFVAVTLTAACNPLFGIHQGNPRPICVGVDDAFDPLIDDMEDGDGFICESLGRHGHWYPFSDGTSVNLTPAGDFNPSLIPGRRGTSLYAARLAGSGFTNLGAGMGFNLNKPDLARLSYDVSTIDGITFWTKSTTPLRVNFPTPHTTDPKIDGDCVDPNCGNYFGFDITAPLADWVEYEVPFSALRQAGGGTATWDPQHLIAIEFQVPPGAPFEVWVDDIRFHRCGGVPCRPTCVDPDWPTPCPASGVAPARCWPQGSDCVVGCGPSNTTAAPADGLIAAFSVPGGGVQAAVAVGPAESKPMFTTDGELHITVNAPVISTSQVLLVDLPFPGCVDASAFTGLQFSISGSLSGCTFGEATQDSAHATYDGSRPTGPGAYGTGAPGSIPNSTALTADQITPMPQTITMPFALQSNGVPATPTDKSQLIWIDWVFIVDPYVAGGPTACTADLTISDVKFY
jgi:hypothetical protein